MGHVSVLDSNFRRLTQLSAKNMGAGDQRFYRRPCAKIVNPRFWLCVQTGPAGQKISNVLMTFSATQIRCNTGSKPNTWMKHSKNASKRCCPAAMILYRSFARIALLTKQYLPYVCLVIGLAPDKSRSQVIKTSSPVSIDPAKGLGGMPPQQMATASSSTGKELRYLFSSNASIPTSTPSGWR